ncbi:hypothetical protein H5410_004946 [Solanum commersonii]|uniref:Uncharacterized protein n=1 Tax=Solanum commersonii TaxID=4109 RepID=A0A9J6A5T7_SOLCO|nr:hypothetical protein H5410_004946 [Solanum commersonii]
MGRYGDHDLWGLPWSLLGCPYTPSSQGLNIDSASRPLPRTVMRTTVSKVDRDLYLVQPNFSFSKPSYWKCFTTGTTSLS